MDNRTRDTSLFFSHNMASEGTTRPHPSSPLTPSHLVNLVTLLQSIPHPPQPEVGLGHGHLKPVALHVIERLQRGKSLLKGQSRGSLINVEVTNYNESC